MGFAITSKTERHAILQQTAPNDFSMVRAEKMETLPDKETDKDFDETMPKGPIDNRFWLAGGEYFLIPSCEKKNGELSTVIK
jgi:hypothetical protein